MASFQTEMCECLTPKKLLAKMDTLVFVMGTRSLSQIAQRYAFPLSRVRIVDRAA